MQKSKRFGHIISLSKPPGMQVQKPFKCPTSLPSPRKGSKKFSFSLRSPHDKESDLILIKRKFLNKSKQTKSTSNYLSFANPINRISITKKNTLNTNTSIKSQLMLASVDYSTDNKIIKDILVQKKKGLNIAGQSLQPSHIREISTSLKTRHNPKKSSVTTLSTRKNSSEKNSCRSLIRGTSLYNKLLKNKKLLNKINVNKSISQNINHNLNKKKISSTTASSPVNSNKHMSMMMYSKRKLIKNKTSQNSKTSLHKTIKSVERLDKKNKPVSNSNSNSSTKNYNQPQKKASSSVVQNKQVYKKKMDVLINNSLKEIDKIKQNFKKHFSSNNSPKYITRDKKPMSNEMLPNPSISTLSSSNIDNSYYLSQSNKISQFIKQSYQKNKKYPETTINFYKYGRLIGQGAFGKVNLGLNVLCGRIVAIKSFNKHKLKKNEESKKKIFYETNLMKKLNHPSITKILEVFETDKYILIIMEYINGGNLYSFVKKRRHLTEKTAKFLFKQIIQGIKYMHQNHIVHRDIKLENILIDLNNNIKICDFGIGKVLSENNSILYDQCGTPMYIAPEILLCRKDKGYEAYPVDIWSAGIALYIMLSGNLPFTVNCQSRTKTRDNNTNELQLAIISKDPKPITDISPEAQDLLKGLLDKNPKTRLTPDQILNHPWLREDLSGEKYHLFTKAEMIMLSKTYIDYRYAKVEDLKENFTISNLNSDEALNNLKNNETKSLILAPYNSIITDQLEFELGICEDLPIQNNIVQFSNRIKEYNMNYELNNNGELDNGVLINSKFDMENMVTESIYYYEEEKSMKTGGKVPNKKVDEESLLKKIEKLGYDRSYVLNCIKNNQLCYATAVYYLLKNYEHID